MRALLFSFALLIVGCADVASLTDTVRSSLPPGGGTYESSDGSIPDAQRTDWETTYGAMQLSPLAPGRVTAYYEGGNSSLDGTLRGDRYSGTWVEPSSNQKCDTIRRDSYYWGRFEFTFNAARDRFEGVWAYCDDALRTDWVGSKN